MSQLLIFSVDNNKFGVDVNLVSEITKQIDVSEVPNSSRGVRGITHLRGAILPVIDLCSILDNKDITMTLQTSMIVINNKYALLIDSVSGIINFNKSGIMHPSMLGKSKFISGYINNDSNLIGILDVDSVIKSVKGVEL